MKNKFYITTTLPYVNSDPHVGFAMEIIRADVVARYHRNKGEEVFFNTGTDEHGIKIYQKAIENGETPKKYVDRYAEEFKKLKVALNLSYDNFVRTTDESHIEAAREFWKACDAAGDIYKKQYKIKYCVGCELEKTDSELVDGKCPLHTDRELEIIEEENYFFRGSKYQQKLLDLYNANPDFVTPPSRLNEITKFIERGLEDFSISRLKEKMPWGIPVPGDENQVMYVWFDALVNYIDVIGWPKNMETFNSWWPVVQYAGKDNLRQQSAMWQAMLMSANLPPSKRIIINGFITSGGQKMSKSIGNVINPLDVVKEYGEDPLRYFLLREISAFEDGDFTMEHFKNAYNGNLANGLGNLVSRVMKMSKTNLLEPINDLQPNIPTDYDSSFDNYNLNNAANIIWQHIGESDKYIQDNQPFKTVKVDPLKGKAQIQELVGKLYTIAVMLDPFLPKTAEAIKKCIAENKTPAEPLFLRKD